jgi:hypothetical protein
MFVLKQKRTPTGVVSSLISLGRVGPQPSAKLCETPARPVGRDRHGGASWQCSAVTYIVPPFPRLFPRAGRGTSQSKVETKPRPVLMIDRREEAHGIR